MTVWATFSEIRRAAERTLDDVNDILDAGRILGHNLASSETRALAKAKRHLAAAREALHSGQTTRRPDPLPQPRSSRWTNPYWRSGLTWR